MIEGTPFIIRLRTRSGALTAISGWTATAVVTEGVERLHAQVRHRLQHYPGDEGDLGHANTG